MIPNNIGKKAYAKLYTAELRPCANVLNSFGAMRSSMGGVLRFDITIKGQPIYTMLVKIAKLDSVGGFCAAKIKPKMTNPVRIFAATHVIAMPIFLYSTGAISIDGTTVNAIIENSHLYSFSLITVSCPANSKSRKNFSYMTGLNASAIDKARQLRLRLVVCR